MRRLLFLPAVMLGASMLATAVSAQPADAPDGHGWMHYRGDTFMHEVKQLDLNDAQKTSISQFRDASRQQLKPQLETLRQDHQAFDAAVPGSAGYQAAADNLAQAFSGFASARVQQEAALRTQVYGLLSDAQKTALAKLQAEHQAKEQAWQAQHAQQASP